MVSASAPLVSASTSCPTGLRRRPTLLSAVLGTALLASLSTLTACEGGDPSGGATCDAANFCEEIDGVAQCQEGYEWEDEANLICAFGGVPLLGSNGHTLDDVVFEEVANRDDGLREPRDIAFHPTRTDELWTLNFTDSSTTVFLGIDRGEPAAIKYNAFGNTHFMAHPAALAFSDTGIWASAQEEDDLTQGPVEFGGTPADFMGPSLWPDDLNLFDSGHASHLDMMHNSPNAVGIAWETGNAYWIYDGYHRSLSRYDFAEDHGPGGSYHGDGSVLRYVESEVSYEPGVTSSMVFEHDTSLLFLADSAENCIKVLDTTTGTVGASYGPNYDGGDQNHVNEAELMVLIDGDDIDGMERPSGLEFHGDYMFVTDNATGRIFAFTKNGELLDYLDTEIEGLQGMAFDDDGRMYIVHPSGDRIVRIGEL